MSDAAGLMLTVRLGWRNLWRNPRRSAITVAGGAFAFAFLIALVGFGHGLSRQVLRNGTELMVGDIQLHDTAYLPDRELHRTMGGAQGAAWPELLERLRRLRIVRHAVPRVYSPALLSTGDRSAGAQLVGVEPESETRMSRVFTRQAAAALAAPGSLVLGDLLALDLGAGLGSEVALVAQAFDGTLGNALFRVTGIVHTGMPQLDRSLAFVRLEDGVSLLALPAGRIHEIAIKIDDPMAAPTVAQALVRRAGLPPTISARSWRELLPQLSSYVQMVDGVNRFLVALVVLFASMSVLNTMTMATFERIPEFGMLSAIGMEPAAITRSVLVESFLLVLLSLAGGLALGSLLMQYLMTRGMDLTWWMDDFAMVETRLDPIVKAAWDWRLVAWAAVSLALAAVAAAYWPARRGTRLDPVVAMGARPEVRAR